MKASIVKKIVLQMIGGSPIRPSLSTTIEGVRPLVQVGGAVSGLVAKFGSIQAAVAAFDAGSIISNPIKGLTDQLRTTFLADSLTSITQLTNLNFPGAAGLIQSGLNNINSAISNLDEYSNKLLGLALPLDEELLVTLPEVLNLKKQLGDPIIDSCAAILDPAGPKALLDKLITEQKHKFELLFTDDGVQRDTAAADIGTALSEIASQINASITENQNAQTVLVNQLEKLSEVDSFYSVSNEDLKDLISRGILPTT